MLVVQVEMLKSITLVCVQYVYVQNHIVWHIINMFMYTLLVSC